MRIRFSKSHLATLAIVTGGLVLPGLSAQPATAAPSMAAKKPMAAKGKHGGAMARLKTDLNLTDAQVAKLKPIFKASSDRRKALMANKSLTPDQRKTRMREISKDRMKKVKLVLTAAQWKKWEQIRKERRKHLAQLRKKA